MVKKRGKKRDEKRDIYGYDLLLKNAIKLIKNSEITDQNKKYILNFQKRCFVEGIGKPRVIKYLYHLRDLAKWLKKDFREATKDDIESLILKIQESDYSDNTKKDYKVALKKFYKFLCGGEDYPDTVRWIKTGLRNNNNKLPEDMLSEEEVKKMLDVSMNLRDRALISFLYESGCRVGELLSLQIKHVEFDEHGALVLMPYGKTGGRRIRVISSSPHLSLWIENHPLKNDRDAPLWVGIGQVGRNKPMNYPSVRKVLRDTGERAGIQKKVNPHNFRHSRATFLAKHLTESQLKQVLGWVQASRMASTYVHLSQRDTDSAIKKIYGIKEGEKKERESILKPKKCERCGFVNPTEFKFCGKCGSPLDIKAVFRIEDEISKITELLKSEEFRKTLAMEIVKKGIA
jgi:site-specific recombinase XerD